MASRYQANTFISHLHSIMLRLLIVSCAAVVCVRCVPVRDFEQFDDSQIVQSLIREVRAAPESVHDLIRSDTEHAFLHKYSDGDDGDKDQGYHKRVQDDGGKGYKHFDSYHKKDGDKYGIQHHTAYGKAHKDGAEDKGYEAGDGKENSQLQHANDGEEAKMTYSVVESDKEDYDDHAGTSGSYSEESAGDESDGDVGYYTEGNDDNSEGGHYTAAAESDDDGEGYGDSEHYSAHDESDYY